MNIVHDVATAAHSTHSNYQLPEHAVEFQLHVLQRWDDADGKALAQAFGNAGEFERYARENPEALAGVKDHHGARAALVKAARQLIADGKDFESRMGLKKAEDRHRADGVTQEIEKKTNLIERNEIEGHPTRGVATSPKEEKPKPKTMRDINRERAEWFASVVSLPLEEFMARAWEFSNSTREMTMGWHTDLFWFTWLVRGHPRMEPYLTKPKKALETVELYLRSWSQHRKKKNDPPPYGHNAGDAWMDWFGIQKEDARAEFCDVWMKCRYMPGQGPLEQAIDAARQMRLNVRAEVAESRPLAEPGERSEKDYEFFISAAGHLQVIVGDQNIKLPCEKLGDLLGVSKMTISRYCQWAMKDGFLAKKKAHRFSSKGQSDAAEFRFDISRWDVLRERAQSGTAEHFHGAA